jgi:hypothetical protein
VDLDSEIRMSYHFSIKLSIRYENTSNFTRGRYVKDLVASENSGSNIFSSEIRRFLIMKDGGRCSILSQLMLSRNQCDISNKWSMYALTFVMIRIGIEINLKLTELASQQMSFNHC